MSYQNRFSVFLVFWLFIPLGLLIAQTPKTFRLEFDATVREKKNAFNHEKRGLSPVVMYQPSSCLTATKDALRQLRQPKAMGQAALKVRHHCRHPRVECVVSSLSEDGDRGQP